jgi:hypothetical protein
MNQPPINLTVMSSRAWEQQEIVRLLRGAPGTQYQEADDANKAIIRDWVRSLAQKSVITVTFVKADGTIRDMKCTLDGAQIPIDKQPRGQAVQSIDGIVRESRQRREPDEHSLRVFDVDKQEWRSFRFDRLQKVTAEIGLA